MYKRKVIKILALALALSCLFGCTGKESGNTTSAEQASVSQETTTKPTTTEPNTTEESTTEAEKTTEESTSKVEEKTTEKSTEIDIQPVTEKEVTTTKKETTTEKEVTTTKKEEPTTEKKVTYTKKKETVYAKSEVNIRKSASTNSKIVGVLNKGDKITRTATGDNGWSKVTYNGDTCYIYSSYLTTTKPVEETTKKKEETTTKKEESTTKNEPYTYVDKDGTKYEVDENGIKRVVNENASGGVTGVYTDANYCSVCGKKSCGRAVTDYYCVVCKKTIEAHTCHPESHYQKSH